MTTRDAVEVEWVCSEGSARSFATRVTEDGGTVLNATPFVPRPEEVDLYSDAEFDPLLVVGTTLGIGLLLRYAREIFRDLKGREVAVVDLTGPTPQVRVVPVGAASQVIVKAPDGSVATFATGDTEKIEQSLTSLLTGAKKAGGPALPAS